CPSFVTIEATGNGQRATRGPEPSPLPASRYALPPNDSPLPTPSLKVPAGDFAMHMMGVGGTGVVTVAQVLATAALLDGRHIQGLDQTGLSQKGGPVVSDLRLSAQPIDGTGKVSSGGADLYLGFDLLVATDPRNLAKADRERTVAVIST